MKKRMWNIFVATSILLSAIIFGSYKKTLSASLGEIENHNYFAKLTCNVLEIVLNDDEHCLKEYNDYLREGEK
tara:strand:- start:15591 stop:15809 length:219 start_codon:yes stop_codon:yes gene_type:complete